MAGRTFFITKPTVTTNQEPITMNATIIDLPNDDLDTVASAPAVPAPLTACLTEILGETIPTVRSGILVSFVSSLNLQLVLRCREAIRQRAQQRDERNDDETPSIDQRADADDAAGLNSGCYDQGTVEQAAGDYAGNPLPLSAFEVAKRLAVIRSFCHAQQESLRPNSVIAFTPRPLSESIDWLRSQLPVNTKPTDPAILVAMQLTGMSAEQCVAIRNAGHASESAELEAVAAEVISLGETLTSGFVPDARAAEDAFDGLPAQLKANVMISAINACVSCYNSAFKKVVMRGNAAAAGDMVIAKSLHERGMRTLKQLCVQHQAELSEFEARGGMLKEVRTLS